MAKAVLREKEGKVRRSPLPIVLRIMMILMMMMTTLVELGAVMAGKERVRVRRRCLWQRSAEWWIGALGWLSLLSVKTS